MKPDKIYDIMDLARRARNIDEIFNPLFVGPPGLGKTEIVQQWCRDNGLPFITLTLSSYDPPDFKGLPVMKVDSSGRQRMAFATPDMWPDEGEGVVILEELNRSNSSIMQCVLSLGDKRRGFDGYVLPQRWIVVGCINPEDTEYDVTTMDPALKDRFEMFPVNYDKATFISYMKSSKWNKDIINFVEAGLWMYKTPEEIKNIPGAKYLSPRTFSKLNAAKRATFAKENEIMLYDTILGSNTAKDFFNFLYNETPVMMSDIKKNLKKSLEKLKKFSEPGDYRGGMIAFTIKDILDENTIEEDTLLEISKALPPDQSIVLIRELEAKRNDKKILGRLLKKDSALKEALLAATQDVK